MPRRLRWDRANGRYRDAGGRFIPVAQVRATLDRDLRALDRVVVLLGDDLRSGRLSLEGWRTQMRGIVKHVHMGSAALAAGGRKQMTPADWGRVGQITRVHYGYLEEWVQEIKAGWVLDGRLASRARLYVQHGRTTFHAVERKEMADRGFDEERNRLHPAEHCERCLGLTGTDVGGTGIFLPAGARADGWVPLGTLQAIGTRTCLSNDHCSMEYRNSTTGRIFAAAA